MWMLGADIVLVLAYAGADRVCGKCAGEMEREGG
jgi:hypothetical protein